MAREDLHFRLRIPEDLKAKVQEAANQSHRSMTAEIISRLEQSFTFDKRVGDLELDTETIDDILANAIARIETLEAKVREIENPDF